jgi:hypothetical protein
MNTAGTSRIYYRPCPNTPRTVYVWSTFSVSTLETFCDMPGQGIERRPQRPRYTQTLWREPIQQRRSAKPRMKQVREPGQPASPPSAPTEHIIEGIFLSHNKDTTQQLRTRLQRRGVGSLSNTELFSLVLRTKPSAESIEPACIIFLLTIRCRNYCL